MCVYDFKRFLYYCVWICNIVYDFVLGFYDFVLYVYDCVWFLCWLKWCCLILLKICIMVKVLRITLLFCLMDMWDCARLGMIVYDCGWCCISFYEFVWLSMIVYDCVCFVLCVKVSCDCDLFCTIADDLCIVLWFCYVYMFVVFCFMIVYDLCKLCVWSWMILYFGWLCMIVYNFEYVEWYCIRIACLCVIVYAVVCSCVRLCRVGYNLCMMRVFIICVRVLYVVIWLCEFVHYCVYVVYDFLCCVWLWMILTVCMIVYDCVWMCMSLCMILYACV